MRVTKARLRGTIKRIQGYYQNISIQWAYGQPCIFNADGSRELSPRLPTGQMDNWLHGFEKGFELAHYARNEEIAHMLRGLIVLLKEGIDRSIDEGWELDGQIHARIGRVESMIKRLGGDDAVKRTIHIEISGGMLTDVEGLPNGWDYELCDWDNCSDCGGLDPNCEWCMIERLGGSND